MTLLALLAALLCVGLVRVLEPARLEGKGLDGELAAASRLLLSEGLFLIWESEELSVGDRGELGVDDDGVVVMLRLPDFATGNLEAFGERHFPLAACLMRMRVLGSSCIQDLHKHA